MCEGESVLARPLFARAACLRDRMEFPPMKFETLDAVTVDGQKRWIPEVKVLDGRKFVKIQKWDRGFCLFATGATMERRSGKASNSANLQCIDSLVRLRRQACNIALQRALRVAQESDSAPPAQKKKVTKPVLAREVDHVVAGPIVDLDTECGHRMSVLWSVQTPYVWVEFTEANLQWLRQAVAKDRSQEARGRTRSARARVSKGKAAEQPVGEASAVSRASAEAAKEVAPPQHAC